jgi:uncharacterized protein (DUF697 family)
MDGDFGNATDEDKTTAIRELIEVASIAAAAVTIQPIPFVDTALLAPIQIGMVQGIGRVHGLSLDKKSILEILSTLGASILAQNVILAAAKFVPFLGWVVGPSMAYALTYAIGEVSEMYFGSGRGLPAADMKSMFERVYKAKRAEKEEANKGNATLKQKLEQLTEAFRAGLLTEEEYNRKKEELLKAF